MLDKLGRLKTFTDSSVAIALAQTDGRLAESCWRLHLPWRPPPRLWCKVPAASPWQSLWRVLLLPPCRHMQQPPCPSAKKRPKIGQIDLKALWGKRKQLLF